VRFVRVDEAHPPSAEARQIGSGEIVLHVEVRFLSRGTENRFQDIRIAS